MTTTLPNAIEKNKNPTKDEARIFNLGLIASQTSYANGNGGGIEPSKPMLLIDDIAGYNANTNDNGIGSVSTNYLDSPATTSATTYKIQFTSDNNTSIVRVQNNFNVTNGSTSTITLMEIAA